MQQISRIQAALRPHLPWYGDRLTFVALFLVALFRVETVNLDKLASVFASRAQSASNYKSLTRFFRGFAVNFDAIARAVQYSDARHCPRGVAFPVMWTLLNKQGNSNSDERIELLERFEQLFPSAEIRGLTGDREFVGKEWCSFLLLPKTIPFRLRLRHSDRISSRSGKRRQTGERVFANLQVGEHRLLSSKRWVWGCRVYVVATRLEDGELLILATNHCPKTALADYRLR